MAIGITKMSTKEMREINKGHGVDVVHYLNDGLWKNQQFALRLLLHSEHSLCCIHSVNELTRKWGKIKLNLSTVQSLRAPCVQLVQIVDTDDSGKSDPAVCTPPI